MVIEPVPAADVYSRAILAGLVDLAAGREVLRDRLIFSRAHVRPHFLPATYSALFQVVQRHLDIAGLPPDAAGFAEIVLASPQLSREQKLEYAATFQDALNNPPNEAYFRVACLRVGDRWRDATLGQALVTANEVLYGRGTYNGQVLSGFADAVSFLKGRLEEIEFDGGQGVPEGNVSREAREIMAQYDAAASGVSSRVSTGLTELDNLTAGLARGELWLVAAYTSEGKSSFAYSLAHETVYRQGRHVLLLTNEASRDQVRLSVVSRHSREPQFGPHPGLPYTSLAWGRLSHEDRWEQLPRVLADMAARPGSLYVVQLPAKATVEYVAEALRTRQRVVPVDLVILDYAGLLGSGQKRQSIREELDDVVRSLKRLALEGPPILSGWQMSRDAWNLARNSGGYTKSALSETSQAERSADVVLSLLKADPTTVRMQLLKNRHGPTDAEFPLGVDFAFSEWTDRHFDPIAAF